MASRLVVADCLDALPDLPDASVDAVVSDPPYELGFMGKGWDASGIAYNVALWADVLRVLKPGGHLLAFGGTRTYHRLACAIEDAGFEIRDSIHWVYGSGFPKSLNVSKAVEKMGGNGYDLLPDEQRFCDWMRDESGLDAATVKRLVGSDRFITGEVQIVNTATADEPRWGRRAMVPTAAAWAKLVEAMRVVPPAWVEELVKEPPGPNVDHPSDWKAGRGEGTRGTNDWAGWGTALKPAHEPIVVARKPLAGTVAQNVLAHGTGALNIDATRVGFRSEADERESKDKNRHADFGTAPNQNTIYNDFSMVERRNYDPMGRWPANFVLTHAEGCVQVGEREEAVSVHDAPAGTLAGGEQDRGSSRGEDGGIAYRERTVSVPVWECVEGCPVREMDRQSGTRPGGAYPARRGTSHIGFASGQETEGGPRQMGDTGGASRFFPTFEPGRWPPNFVLTHAEDCREVGVAEDVLGGGARATSGFVDGYESGDGFEGRTIAVPVWECVDGCPVRELDRQSGTSKSTGGRIGKKAQGVVAVGGAGSYEAGDPGYGDEGGASRYFPAFKYQAKANKRERNAGLDDLPDRRQDEDDRERAGTPNPRNRSQALRKNIHPTVKPVELMRWLVRLVTPPGGVVLDPFTGSGTTGVAAVLEGFDFIGIEREPEYAEIAERRIAHAADAEPTLFQSVH